MADVEAQNGLSEETKVLAEEKVPVVKISSPTSKTEEFRGLTKAELMKYADDPKWVRIRWVLFILFWLVWLAMLVASIVIIIYAPKCPSPEPKQWWQKGPIYRADVMDFKNLTALQGEVKYLADTGITTLLLSSLFKGSGEGVSDYKDVAPELGSLEDWDALAKTLKENNMKVIVDMKIDATSTMHEWFERSVAKEADFEDFYVWSDASGSGYVRNDARGQSYSVGDDGLNYPKLNLNNQKVVAELEKVLSFWLNRGVDGFNIIADGLENQEVTEDIVRQFRGIVDKMSEEADDGEQRILVTFTDRKPSETIPLYGQNISATHVGDLFHLVGSQSISQWVIESEQTYIPSAMADFIQNMKEVKNKTAWPPIMANSPIRDSPARVNAYNLLSLILPGTPIFNFGDEIGLVPGESYTAVREQQQKVDTDDASGLTHLAVFRKAANTLREAATVLFGKTVVMTKGPVFVVSRVKKGYPGYLLITNTGIEDVKPDISGLQNIAESLTLVVATGNKTTSETQFESKAIDLQAGESKLFSFVAKFKKGE